MEAKSKLSGLGHNPFVWRITRSVMLVLFRRAGRRVLLMRLLDPADPKAGRWLAPDISPYIGETEKLAETLRPTANFRQFTSFGNRLMVELTVYTVAAYRALLARGMDRDYAALLVADIAWNIYAFGLKLASLPFRLTSRQPEVRIRRTIGFMLRFPFKPVGAPGYEVSVRREGEDLFTDFLHCPPQSFVREVVDVHGDKGDLDAFYKSWCLYDWPGADIIAGDGERGHYQRSKTLSRGDKVCNMCWRAKAVKKSQ
jgi:hypothetical protein